MAAIKEITYEVATTVKVREYEYCKPKISVTITLDPADNEEEVFAELTEVVRGALKTETKELIKQLKG